MPLIFLFVILFIKRIIYINKKLWKERKINMVSTVLKKRFCKDNEYPINIYKDPYFSERLKFFGFYEEWKKYVETVEQFGGENKFLEHCNIIQEKIIDLIKNNEAYKKFETFNMSLYPPFGIQRSRNSIYKKTNTGKILLSIDLSNANFNALRKFDESLVINKKNYYEFISEFTEIEHIRKSKYIRQVIFGHTNPKRQLRIEKHLIGQFIPIVLKTVLSKEEYMAELDKKADDPTNILIAYMDDEIVFDVSNIESTMWDAIIKNIEDFSQKTDIPIKYDFFVLKKIIRIIKQVNSEEEAISETDFYAKESIYPSQNKGKVVFKGVNPIVYPIVYGNYFGKPISDSEKVFYHENMIARIIDDVRYEILDSTQTYEKMEGVIFEDIANSRYTEEVSE